MIYPIYLIILVCFIACSGDNQKNQESTESLIESSGSLRNQESENQIFTLPAPLQIATVLKTGGFLFRDELLTDPKKVKSVYTSAYTKGLNLGVRIVDLGYATVFQQKQTSLNYLKSVKQLLEELGISGIVQNQLVQKFEANIDKPDSLYKIILKSYSDSHDYLRNNKQEVTGLFILCGAYIEGLHLSLNQKETIDKEVIDDILGQQKVFLKNIVELIQYFDFNEDTKNVHLMISDLNEAFEKVNFDQTSNGNKYSFKGKYTKDQFELLKATTNSIRIKIIG